MNERMDAQISNKREFDENRVLIFSSPTWCEGFFYSWSEKKPLVMVLRC